MVFVVFFHFNTTSEIANIVIYLLLCLLIGIMYKIDKFIGTCESDEIVIGQYFVRSQQGTNTIDIVSVAEFFNIGNANVQYVGKVNSISLFLGYANVQYVGKVNNIFIIS